MSPRASAVLAAIAVAVAPPVEAIGPHAVAAAPLAVTAPAPVAVAPLAVAAAPRAAQGADSGGRAEASAAGPIPASDPLVAASLAVERGGHAPSDSVRLTLSLRVPRGWHISAPDPGDAGLPTSIRWELPPGARIDAHWPRPRRLRQAGLELSVYTGRVLIPITLHLPPDSRRRRPVDIVAHMAWGACREICVPERARLPIRIHPP